MPFLPLDLLKSGAAELGIELTDTQLRQFDAFAQFLVETNEKFNLTRITEPEEIVTSHYLDSLTCLQALKIKKGASVIDIGTGAGFPGIPIKIVRPDLRVTLADATFKKVKFISEAVERLGLTNTEPVQARAEEIGREAAFREKYDIVFARALADMKVLAELCLPLVKVGGHVIAQKSADAADEVEAARPMIGTLGGKLDKVIEVRVPHTEITRLLVVVSKTKPTPQQFPRSYAAMTRKSR